MGLYNALDKPLGSPAKARPESGPQMTKKLLTDRAINNFKPAEPGKRYIMGIQRCPAPAFGSRTVATGLSCWVRVIPAHHTSRREIGEVGAVALAAADTARSWLVSIKAGQDPRIAIAAAKADTFTQPWQKTFSSDAFPVSARRWWLNAKFVKFCCPS